MKSGVLGKIIETKRARVAAAKQLADLSELRKAAEHAVGEHRDFLSAISRPERVNIIAEFKRASPSKGSINTGANLAETVHKFEIGGATAISVLTEEDHFAGSLEDLRKGREAVRLPVLRKDFIIDEYQIYESAAAGADAILLIVAALSPRSLEKLQKVVNDLGLDAIFEVHDAEELDIASEIGAKMIGVNNRNLKSFEVSLDVSRELSARATDDMLLVSESGISKAEQIAELRDLGYSGFLIGESLMRCNDPGPMIQELISIESESFELKRRSNG